MIMLARADKREVKSQAGLNHSPQHESFFYSSTSRLLLDVTSLLLANLVVLFKYEQYFTSVHTLILH